MVLCRAVLEKLEVIDRDLESWRKVLLGVFGFERSFVG